MAEEATTLLDKAIEIATEAHKDKVRKISKEPYIEHPKRIAQQCTSTIDKIIAWLHDVVEDTDTTIADLEREGFQPAVIWALQCLTRRNESYHYYITEKIVANPAAIKIKILDLEDNMSDLNEGSMRDKYRFAHQYLKGLNEFHGISSGQTMLHG